jgi:DNA-binding transcriptional LysR family regulator
MPLIEPIPDIRSLEILRGVAETGSISQAALRCGLSQPAASVRLRSLEDALGVRLLDRSHGRARLSTAGIAVVQWSEEVLKAMRELQVGAQALRSDEHTQLRIVASMTVAEYLVPGWLNRLRSSDPDVIVSLEMGNSQHVIDVMLRAEAEIGFVEGQHPPRELSSRVVQSDDLVVVVAPSSEWARRRKPISARELCATPLVLREAGSGTREVLESAMNSHGLSVIPLVELGSTTAIKAAVASGAGPGVLSRLAVEADVQEGRLVAVATDDVALKRSIRVVWSKERPLTSTAKLLLRLIEENATLHLAPRQ